MPQIISHTASAKCYNQMFFLTMKVGGKGTCLVLVLVLHSHDEPRLLFESNSSLVSLWMAIFQEISLNQHACEHYVKTVFIK